MLEEISKSNKTLAFLMGTENNRKSYQEIILRYFALKNYQEYSSSIAKTLNLYMEKHQNDSKEDIEQLKKEFNSNIDIIKQVLGNDAFVHFSSLKVLRKYIFTSLIMLTPAGYNFIMQIYGNNLMDAYRI